MSEADQADWTRRAAEEIWRRDPSVLAVAPFLLAGRLWEDSGIGGWTFADCPPGASSAPCDGALTPRVLFDTLNARGVLADTIFQAVMSVEADIWNVSLPDLEPAPEDQ